MNRKSEQIDNSSRIYWIDVARSLAIICVILCHSVEGVYPLDIHSILALSFQARLFVFTLMLVGRLGVPIFLVLTGYLLLNRSYNVQESINFWKHKCIPLLITTEIWIFIYWAFSGCNNGQLKFENLIRELLFLKNTEINHLWYMPMILGIYMFIPFIANAVHQFTNKILWIILGIVVIYLFLVPFINIVLVFNGEEGITNQLNLSYSGEIYGVYLILGYLISQKDYNLQLYKCISAAVIILSIAIGIQNYFYINELEYKYWYDSIFIFGLTICVVFALIQLRKMPWNRSFTCIAKSSFGIYLMHNIILTQMLQIMPITMDRILKVVLVTVLSFVVSLGVVMVIVQVPKIRKVLFFMK